MRRRRSHGRAREGLLPGAVVLRGRVDSPEAIRELKRAAAETAGVERVRVLLHLPGSAAKRR